MTDFVEERLSLKQVMVEEIFRYLEATILPLMHLQWKNALNLLQAVPIFHQVFLWCSLWCVFYLAVDALMHDTMQVLCDSYEDFD